MTDKWYEMVKSCSCGQMEFKPSVQIPKDSVLRVSVPRKTVHHQWPEPCYEEES